MLFGLSATVTLATAAGDDAEIVKILLPVIPDETAIMFTVPGPTPVTRPVEETVATDGAEVVQVNDALIPSWF
jgi:hypothetical protein